MTTLDRAVLRSALGDDGYREVEAACTLLDRLRARGALSTDGLSLVLGTLAGELVARAVANDLSAEPESRDTAEPEAP